MAGQAWRQYLFGGFANLGLMVCGFVLGWSSPIFGKLDDADLSPLPGPITGDQEAWIGSLLTVGGIFGPVAAGIAALKVGRKWGLVGSVFPFLAGSVVIAVANNLVMIYIARIFWGVGVGMVFTLSPMYCAEIASDDARGVLGSFYQVFISVGFIIVYSIGPNVSYQGVGYASIVVVGIYAAGVLVMPESPIYYVGKNDLESAGETLAMIRGLPRDEVQAELDKMAAGNTTDNKSAKLTDLFRGNNFKAFYMSLVLVILQQLSGITPVFIYLTIIFEASGSSLDPALATIIVGVVQLGASSITPLVVYRLRRRVLLMFSSCGAAIAHILLATYFQLEQADSGVAESFRLVPILALVLFVMMYCWGLGPLPWAVLGELLPREVKAFATPLAAAMYWGVSFLLTRYFTPLADTQGMSVPFWILGACCVFSFLFTLFVLPETKGKSYEEIQDMLAARPSKEAKGSSRY